MSHQVRSTFVVSEPSEIVQALVGLKDVRVLSYVRRGPQVELVIEQIVTDPRCPGCGGRARVKERPLVRYVDLRGVPEAELGAARSPDRGEGLPAHDPGRKVGDGPGRRRPHRVGGRRRAGLRLAHRQRRGEHLGGRVVGGRP